MSAPQEAARGRRPWVTFLLACALAVGSMLSAAPARADEPGETTVGYLLVQQALGHLAHDTSSEGIEIAMEKTDDALSTKDQEGVDVPELQKAMAALQAGQVEQGRALLQHSISGAVAQLKPAIGEETGTKLVLSPLPGRGSLAGGDWGSLVVSVLALLLGVGLAWRFRPQDNVHELRRRLDPPAPGQAAAQPDPPATDAS